MKPVEPVVAALCLRNTLLGGRLGSVRRHGPILEIDDPQGSLISSVFDVNLWV